MLINIENKEIINSKEISVHDGVMGKISYDYDEKSCTFKISNPGWNKIQTFHIKGIIYMELQNCEFWGPGYNVCSWYWDEKYIRTKELFSRKKLEYQNLNSLLNEKSEKYFEHVLYFNSGDEIRFVCEEVEYEQYEYHVNS